ncbi:hypothetical protein N2152v2_004483 [Parachlorella kessleri]
MHGSEGSTSLLSSVLKVKSLAKRAREARLTQQSAAAELGKKAARDNNSKSAAAAVPASSSHASLRGAQYGPYDAELPSNREIAAATPAAASAELAAVNRLPLQPKSAARPLGFQARSFYDNNSKRLQHVEERILRFLANVQSRLHTSCATGGEQLHWQTFPLQQPAFHYADHHNAREAGRPLRVFSVESGPEGKRRFMATTYCQLWRRYSDLLPQHRHYYEIIRQGWPCHLYFDLEYAVADNPGCDGPAAVDALLGLVAQLLQDKFSLQMEDSWVLELDSSTDAKFSRHVIIRAPGAAFGNNLHVGAFVRELCCRAGEARQAHSSCPAARVFVKKGTQETLLVDLGVYTRNRAFRLYLSSKAGKDAVLDCTGRFGGASLTQQEVFQRGLICDVDPFATLLTCFDESREAAAGTAGTPGTAVQYGPSPFPQIEEFITSVCKEGGSAGSVRSWALLDGGSLLLFSMRGNRWCGNIGRQHRSNGVFYVVDLQQGWWCQRCYDPDCRSYRSPLTALPTDLVALYCCQQQEGQQAEAPPSRQQHEQGEAEQQPQREDAALNPVGAVQCPCNSNAVPEGQAGSACHQDLHQAAWQGCQQPVGHDHQQQQHWPWQRRPIGNHWSQEHDGGDLRMEQPRSSATVAATAGDTAVPGGEAASAAAAAVQNDADDIDDELLLQALQAVEQQQSAGKALPPAAAPLLRSQPPLPQQQHVQQQGEKQSHGRLAESSISLATDSCDPLKFL